MHHQLKGIRDEKRYWEERLSRTSNEMFFKWTRNNKKKRLKPVTKAKFMLFHKKHLQNRSHLAETGRLHLDHTLRRPNRGGRNFYTINDWGSKWNPAVTRSRSTLGRTNPRPFSTIRGSATRPANLAWTLSGERPRPLVNRGLKYGRFSRTMDRLSRGEFVRSRTLDPYRPFTGTLRNEVRPVEQNEVDRKTRNAMMVEEKMSKLFTKKRRVAALRDFGMRLEMTLQKKKLKKKNLEKKYYDYDFKPRTNKKRINIYKIKLPAKPVTTRKTAKKAAQNGRSKDLKKTIRKRSKTSKTKRVSTAKRTAKKGSTGQERVQETVVREEGPAEEETKEQEQVEVEVVENGGVLIEEEELVEEVIEEEGEGVEGEKKEPVQFKKFTRKGKAAH